MNDCIRRKIKGRRHMHMNAIWLECMQATQPLLLLNTYKNIHIFSGCNSVERLAVNVAQSKNPERGGSSVGGSDSACCNGSSSSSSRSSSSSSGM